MSIFNSLGSNYSARQTWRSLLPVQSNSAEKLETHLQKDYKSDEVFLTFKCREAITLILQQLQLPAGSHVAINGYTCYVVYQAVIAAGLKPYLLDISKNDLNFTTEMLKSAVKKEPTIRAVIIQNTLGMPSPMEGIRRFCLDQKLFLVEDLAHSAGLIYPTGETAGTVGNGAAFSFSQDKIIDAVSGGAAILFQKKSFEPHYVSVSMWQKLQAYWYPLNTLIIRKTHSFWIGKIWLRLLKILKFLPNQLSGDPKIIRNLPNRQAKLAQRAINSLPEDIEHRQKIATIYRESLPQKVQIPHLEGSLYIRFPLLVEEPRKLEAHLKQAGIYIAQPWYDAVIAPKRYQEHTEYHLGQCPEAEYVAEHMVNLPTHININVEQAQALAEKVNQWLSQ